MATGIVAMAVLALSLEAFNAVMAPYKAEHAKVNAVLREGGLFVEKLRTEMGEDATLRLGKAYDYLLYINNFLHVVNETQEVGIFEMDPSIFVAEDQPKAERLQRDYKETEVAWSRATNEVAIAANRAAALMSDIQILQKSNAKENAECACSDLEQCLAELNTLNRQALLKSSSTEKAMERYTKAYANALSVRVAFCEWIAKAESAVAEAHATSENVNDASEHQKDVAKRAEAIRQDAKSLRVDLKSARLKTLRADVASAVVALEKSEGNLRGTLKSAEDERAKLVAKARAYCEEVAKTVSGLNNLHGEFLPHDAVESGQMALETFNKAVSDFEAKWKEKQATIAKILGNFKTIQGECAKSIQALDNVLKTGNGLPDSIQIAGLPARCDALGKEMALAIASLNLDEFKHRIAKIIGQAQKDLEAVEAAKPDVPTLLKEISDGAKAIRSLADSAKHSLSETQKIVEDGHGDARESLQAAVTSCLSDISSLEDDLRTMEGVISQAKLQAHKGATMVNGKDIVKLNRRMQYARNAITAIQDKISHLGKDIKQSIENGSFALVSWDEGAIGWNPFDRQMGNNVLTGDLLYAPAEVSSPSYRWEFDLDIASEGNHKIEVIALPSGKGRVCNLNVAMPDRKLKGGDYRGKAKGGWIRADILLASGNLKWSKPYFLKNRDSMKPREAVVLDGVGQFPKGQRTFMLSMDLSVDLSQVENRQKSWIPDGGAIYRGWRPSGIAFKIYLDGEQVHQFWHRVR